MPVPSFLTLALPVQAYGILETVSRAVLSAVCRSSLLRLRADAFSGVSWGGVLHVRGWPRGWQATSRAALPAPAAFFALPTALHPLPTVPSPRPLLRSCWTTCPCPAACRAAPC